MTSFNYSIGNTEGISHHALGNPAATQGLRGTQRLFGLPAYHWMLISSALVMAAHLFYAPTWLVVMGLAMVVLQAPKMRHILATVSKIPVLVLYTRLQKILLCVGLIGLWVQFGLTIGTELAVAFLLLCLMIKLWEVKARRDAYVVLNLNFFVLASAFLWTQDLGMALKVVVALLACLFALIALSDDENTTGAGRLRALALLAIPALPLLVVLFLFFPRMPPLWSLQMAGAGATSGISDSMSPGDFSNLSKSTELAFRVEFEGNIPSREQMYWRTMVFTRFDGVTWRQSDAGQQFWQSAEVMPEWASNAYQGQSAGRYQVILEPTNQQWLFGLDYPQPESARDIGMNQEFNLRSYTPVTQQRRYWVMHYPNAKIDLVLSDRQRQLNLSLPDGNPKTRALAQQLKGQSQGNSRRLVALIQEYILTNQFRYTLSPPLLQQERIDEFLFDTKAGFCEHYASSFVFLMRAAGVPARVVTGYQGGQLGRDGNSWEVRQMDAHAWAEIWIEQQGWVRIDPTGFVSPERVELGMNALTDSAGAEMFGEGVAAQWGYQQFRLMQSLRRYADQASYYWQKDVVGYDQDVQKNSLLKWFNIKNLAQQIILMGVLAVSVFGVFVGVMMYRRRRIYHPFDLPVVHLSNNLSKKDKALMRATSESALTFLSRIGERAKYLHPKSTSEIELLIDELHKQYRAGRYGKEAKSISNKKNAQSFARLVQTLAKYF